MLSHSDKEFSILYNNVQGRDCLSECTCLNIFLILQIFWSSLNQRSGDGWGREAQFNARERRHANGSIPFTFSVNNNLSFHDLLGVFFPFLNESRVNRYWLLNIPGQPRRLQRRTWMAGPNEWHIFPPPEGRGLLQILVRTWAPPPQDLSQLPQSDQLLYPPSERRKRNTSSWNIASIDLNLHIRRCRRGDRWNLRKLKVT